MDATQVDEGQKCAEDLRANEGSNRECKGAEMTTKTVPVEPTEEMIRAACLNQSGEKFASYEDWWNSHTTGISDKIRRYVAEDYKAMIAAAPAIEREVSAPIVQAESATWHAPGIGEVHNADHSSQLYCETNYVVDDALAKFVCAKLNATLPDAQAEPDAYRHLNTFTGNWELSEYPMDIFKPLYAAPIPCPACAEKDAKIAGLTKAVDNCNITVGIQHTNLVAYQQTIAQQAERIANQEYLLDYCEGWWINTGKELAAATALIKQDLIAFKEVLEMAVINGDDQLIPSAMNAISNRIDAIEQHQKGEK